MPGASFAELLSCLAIAHENELKSVRDACAATIASQQEAHDGKAALMAAEMRSLRELLTKSDGPEVHSSHPMESTVVSIDGEDKKSPGQLEGCDAVADSEAHVPLTLKAWWSRAAIWGKDDVTLSKSGANVTAHLHLMTSVISKMEAQVTNCLGCKNGVIFPHSHFRVGWDLVSLLLIIGDVLMLPFILAFDPERTTALTVIEMFSLIFWTCDMFQGPFLGYYDHGHYVNSHRRVVKEYLKTWFIVDLLVVFPEWLVLILGGGADSPVNAVAGLGKVFKSIRVVRILRLLRLAKIKRLMELLYDMSKDEFTFVLLNVLQLIVFVLLLNHLIACSWYAVAKAARKRGDDSWISLVIAKDQVEAPSYFFLYLLSLHWSLTQFTPASMRVAATTEGETIFSIIVLFFALLVFSSFVGSITNHINRLRSLKISSTKELWSLRRFLRERKISRSLSKRIYKYVEHKLSMEAGHVKINETDIMPKLSRALGNELAYDLHSKVMCCHPFFACLSGETEIVMHRICQMALQVRVAAKDEVVFIPGDEGKYMYMVQSGELEYNCTGHHVVMLSATQSFSGFDSVKWISEPVLWVAWRHRGQLIVGPYIPSTLLFLDPQNFFEVMSLHPRSWLFATIYGEHLVGYFSKLSKLSDVIVDEEFCKQATLDSNAIASNPWEAERGSYGLQSWIQSVGTGSHTAHSAV